VDRRGVGFLGRRAFIGGEQQVTREIAQHQRRGIGMFEQGAAGHHAARDDLFLEGQRGIVHRRDAHEHHARDLLEQFRLVLEMMVE